MADNQINVRRASDQATITMRSVETATGVHTQVVQSVQGPETVPTLTGATLGLIAVTTSAAVALDPPDAGADICTVRVWNTAGDTDVRIFYRRDGTNPTTNGANAEGFLMHSEGKVVTQGTLANFKVIAESGTWQMTCEFTNI